MYGHVRTQPEDLEKSRPSGFFYSFGVRCRSLLAGQS
jgi:hypothetical protein